jgi:hypothetical protein
MKRRVSISCLAILVFHSIGSSPPSGGPWYALYERALNAQDEKDWKSTTQLLREAIQAKPDPALKAKTYGLRFVNYVPYFYLGVAQYHLGNKAEALKQFAISEQHGVIKGAPEEYFSLRQIRAELTGEAYAPLDGSPTGPADGAPDVNSGNAPWYVSYETGLAYVEAGDWLNSVENLKHALAVKGIPRSYARTYGLWYVSYLPYYYLGLSYYNQGLWPLAIEYLETSERFGEVKGFPTEYENLQHMLAEAKTKGTQSRGKLSSGELKDLMNAELTRAVKLFNEESVTEAKTLFLRVLRLDPYNSVAKQYLSRIQDGDGNATESAAYHAYLGAAYAEQYLHDKKKNNTALVSANTEFRRARKIDPAYTLDPHAFSAEVLQIFDNALEKGNR